MGGLNIRANYTFMETIDKSEGSLDRDMPLIRRPKHKVGFISTYSFAERVNVSLEIIYVGERDDKDFSTFPASRVVLDSYTILNAATQIDVNNWLVLTGRVENLFDKDYEDVLGYATPGISGYVGLKIHL